MVRSRATTAASSKQRGDASSDRQTSGSVRVATVQDRTIGHRCPSKYNLRSALTVNKPRMCQMPDLPLQRFLSFLPLDAKLKAQRVCRRWRHLTDSVFHQQKTLVLRFEEKRRNEAITLEVLPKLTRYYFFSDESAELNLKGNLIQLSRKCLRRVAAEIPTRYPALHHLKIHNLRWLTFDELINLLEFYQDRLLTLEIASDDQAKVNTFYRPELFEALAKMKRLTNLCLPFDKQMTDYPELWESITRKCSTVWTVGEITGHAVYERIRSPRVDRPPALSNAVNADIRRCTSKSYGALEEVLCFNAASQLTGIGLYWGRANRGHETMDPWTVQVMDAERRLEVMLAGHQETLTHVDLEMPLYVRFHTAIPQLSKLPALSHLRLATKHVCNMHPGLDNTVFYGISTESANGRNGYKSLLKPALPQVAFLTLARFRFKADDPILYFFIPHLFPNLRTLHLEDCDLSKVSHAPEKLFFSKYTALQSMWHNNALLFHLKRPKAGETEAEVGHRVDDMVSGMIKLKENRVNKLKDLNVEVSRQLGNFSETSYNIMIEYARRREEEEEADRAAQARANAERAAAERAVAERAVVVQNLLENQRQPTGEGANVPNAAAAAGPEIEIVNGEVEVIDISDDEEQQPNDESQEENAENNIEVVTLAEENNRQRRQQQQQQQQQDNQLDLMDRPLNLVVREVEAAAALGQLPQDANLQPQEQANADADYPMGGEANAANEVQFLGFEENLDLDVDLDLDLDFDNDDYLNHHDVVYRNEAGALPALHIDVIDISDDEDQGGGGGGGQVKGQLQQPIDGGVEVIEID